MSSSKAKQKMTDRDSLGNARQFAAGVNRMLKLRDISRPDLAKTSGLPYSKVVRACRGSNNTTIDTGRRIAEALSTTIDYLLSEPIEKIS